MDNNDNIKNKTKTGEEVSVPNSPKNTSNKTPLIIAFASLAIVGLLGIGIFGLIKILNQNNPEQGGAPSNPAVATTDSVFSFLKLENVKDNIIYSPLSIDNGLSLLSAGAANDTKAEIDKVLGDTVLPKYNNIENTLSLANAVFIRDDFKDDVLSSYESTVKNDLSAEIVYDQFLNSNNIDQWAKNKTFGLIDKLGVTPNSNTQMILANALAIQMDWKYPIDDFTRGINFYKQNGSVIKATTMSQNFKTEDVKYYIDDDVTAISLPLDTKSSTNLDFVAIMPSSDIDEYINNIDSAKANNILSNLISASKPKDGVDLNIPSFKFDYTLKFKEDLEALGVKSAFSADKADFSNMASKPLYVSSAIHKANIDFTEKGIKAAAVTAFGGETASAQDAEIPQPIEIDINHPFVFLIRDRDNGVIWFTGAVYQPNLWKDER